MIALRVVRNGAAPPRALPYTVSRSLTRHVALASAVLMSTGNYMLFVSVSSALIVVGGTLTTALVSYSYPLMISSLRASLLNLVDERNRKKRMHQSILRSLEWNRIFRSGGISALEGAMTPQELKDDVFGEVFNFKAVQQMWQESVKLQIKYKLQKREREEEVS